MPHRPEEGLGSSISGVNSSAVYTPPRVAESTAAAIMRQQGAHNNYGGARSPSGVVTPVVKSKHWSMMPGIDARTSNKSSDSTDRSTGTNDDSRSIATLATEDEREVTASALMMVAQAAEREHYLSAVVPSSSTSTGSSSSTVPLKKRKKQMDIIRRQEQQDNEEDHHHHHHESSSNTDDNNNNKDDHTTEQNPCHISPVSHSSSEQGEDGTSVRRTNPSSAHSYDSKDLHPSYRNSGVVSKGETTQELLDSSKVHSTAQIGAQPSSSTSSSSSTFPSQVLIPHFPTVLHHVLVDKELDGKVIQWLPDGEAWKVIRWDAMRRQVLPKYFADLRDENGSGCGTIDAFLYHLDAWGFEEIQDGINAGAYRNDMFIRGAQKLCVKMRFTSDSIDGDKLPKTVSPNRSRGGETERSMLQVPMLGASVGTADLKTQAPPLNKRPRYDTQGPMHWPYSTNDSTGIWGGQYPHDSPHARAYGMRAAAAAAMINPYSPNNGSFNIDPRMQQQTMPMQMSSQHQYNPPQVRSGRGALRLATSAKNRASAVSSPTTTPTFRHGFPVSNRGKGPRKPAACRNNTLVALTSVATVASDSKQQESKESTSQTPSKHNMSVTLSEAQRIGSSVQGVAVAISRKTKRKLPLASRKKSDNDGTSRDIDINSNTESNAIDDSKTTICTDSN